MTGEGSTKPVTEREDSMTAEEFKAERKRLGLTMVAMAQSIGVSQQAIWYYETGKRSVPKPVEMLLTERRVAEKGSE
jgi:transcriptional regulator with XRE-family HTH domain|tara:strand:- start:21170 stop:21400 length:231 start_codon:yes stop_codon:yes gene_type:complete